jgi:hypothetical protein
VMPLAGCAPPAVEFAAPSFMEGSVAVDLPELESFMASHTRPTLGECFLSLFSSVEKDRLAILSCLP